MIRFALLCSCVTVVGSSLAAQTERPDACPSITQPSPRSDAQKREARKVAEQARQAAIVDGSEGARALLKRAVELDPTDPNTVYALARSYDAAKEPGAAIDEYCRFLALTPNATESGDVKRRINTLAEDLPRRSDVADLPAQHLTPAARSPDAEVPAAAPANAPMASASKAGIIPTTRIIDPYPTQPSNLVYALSPFVPGLAQYATHRPFFGALVTASSLGALYMGFHRENKTVTTITGIGRRQERHTTVTSERPNLAAGVTLAFGISMLAGLEAYVHGHGPGPQARPAHRNAVVLVSPYADRVGVGMSVAFK